GLLLATLHKIRDEGFKLPSAAVALSPWTDLALTGQSLHSNARSDPLMDVTRLPAYAQRYLAGADPRHPYASPLYGDASGLPQRPWLSAFWRQQNLRLFLLRKVRIKTIELTRPAPVSIPASTCKSGATAPRRKFRDNFVRLTSPCASCRSRA